MKYVKRNAQVLLVDDSQVESYQRKGFEEFTLPVPVPDLDAMKVEELKAYAEGKGIDLAGATAKADIIAKLKGAQ